ncbi:DUF397 domain-containing protein [Streptomyces anandii]|uniref:DUF397 domain-containing protein n=1 Tax=Streptomyces anandii TaxID=285454 RepID=UPI00370076AC
MHDKHWHRSTYSGDGSNCVEISRTPNTVRVRDSKPPADLRLTFPSTAWADFIFHMMKPER